MVKKVQSQLSVVENENTITRCSRSWDDQFRDRANYNRAKVLTQVINAWRSNPLAKCIIEITTEFAVGDGFGYTAKHNRVTKFLDEFWHHSINDMESQLSEWADEAWVRVTCLSCSRWMKPVSPYFAPVPHTFQVRAHTARQPTPSTHPALINLCVSFRDAILQKVSRISIIFDYPMFTLILLIPVY